MSVAAPARAPAPGERRMYWAIADCWTIVRRGLIHLIRQPSQIAWRLGFPIVSVLLFVYVFGSAMDVDGGTDHTAYAMPGMFAMTMAFGFMNTALMVDKERGDRPLSLDADVAVGGRHGTRRVRRGARHARSCGAGDHRARHRLALGGGLPATLAAFGLLLWLRFSLIWIGVYLGLITPNQEAAGNLFAVASPFGMISSVFTPPHLMPDWLGAIAMWNPVSSTANAVRELFGNPLAGGGSWIEQDALLMAVVWPILITAVFLPLAVRRYQRLSR
jgi:ABC-2 type transport system permease protein